MGQRVGDTSEARQAPSFLLSHLRWGWRKTPGVSGLLGKGLNARKGIGPPGLDRPLLCQNPMLRLSPSRSGGGVCSSRKWVGLLDRLRTSLRQASRSLCISDVRWVCLPVALLRACCTCVNMPLYPATAGVMLHSIPGILRHLRSDVVWDDLGMAASVPSTLACRLSS